MMHTLEPLGVRIIERAIKNYACEYFNTCVYDNPLQLINSMQFGLASSQAAIDEFYSRYRCEFEKIDAFLCMHYSPTCEIFVPFNKPIIIIATIRYDHGHLGRWHHWNEVLKKIAQNPNNVVGANNVFDVEHMRFYTGISPLLMPSLCRYTRTTYNPTRPGFLLGDRRDVEFTRSFVQLVDKACVDLNLSVDLRPVKSLHGTYKNHHLTSHRGIVALPLQPSMMALFEQYGMNIPLFLPAKNLLIEWQRDHNMFCEMYLQGTGVVLPAANISAGIPDPNHRNANDSLHHWLPLSDWYTEYMPHVILYDSVNHLVQLLNTTTDETLLEVSRRMKKANRITEKQTLKKWKDIVHQVKALRNARECCERVARLERHVCNA